MEEKEEDKITDISDLPNVGPVSAGKLRDAGMDTLVSIAVSSPDQLSELSGLSEVQARKIIQIARNNVGFNYITGDVLEEEYKNKNFQIKTNSVELDKLYGGGLESGGIHEGYGKASSGKSQLGFQLCVNVQEQYPDSKVIFVDTEGTWRPQRIRQMAEARKLNAINILKNIYVIKPFNTDMQLFAFEKAEELIKKEGNIKLIVLDSLLNHFRNDYQARGKLADRQQKLNKHLHHLNKIAQIYNVVIYYSNQVMMNPAIMYGNPVTPVGGEVLAHQSTTRVYLSKSAKGITAKMVDSSSLPSGECMFQVTEKGLEDI